MAAGDDLRELAADLNRGVDPAKVRGVVRRAGVNIKAQLRAEAKASRHFRIEQHIGFDEREFWSGPGVDVGTARRGAGRLAGIAYFGGANGGGGTLPDPAGALEAETPRFIKALADLADEALR